MSLFKTEAIILSNARSGESSLLVHCYMKDGGLNNLLAKGARNPKSVMVGKLEPFSLVEILFYRSDAEKLGVVSQVDLIRAYPEISEDIKRLSYASSLVEILESLVSGSESNPEIFRLFTDSLYQMNYCHGSKYDFYFSAFLLKLLDLSGYSPEFSRCVRTGEDLSDVDEVLFSAEAGGLVSHDAADGQEKYFKLNKGTRKVLSAIQSTDMDKLGSLNFSQGQKKLVRALLMKFLAVHIEKPPAFSSLEFLEKIKPVG